MRKLPELARFSGYYPAHNAPNARAPKIEKNLWDVTDGGQVQLVLSKANASGLLICDRVGSHGYYVVSTGTSLEEIIISPEMYEGQKIRLSVGAPLIVEPIGMFSLDWGPLLFTCEGKR